MSALKIYFCVLFNIIILNTKIIIAKEFKLIPDFRLLIDSGSSFRNLSYAEYVILYTATILDSVMIDFRFRTYVHQIEITTIGTNKLVVKGESFGDAGLKSTIYTIERFNQTWRQYNSNEIIRVVRFSGTLIYTSFKFYGYDTFYDKYLGCFNATSAIVDTKMNFNDCLNHCKYKTKYFGIHKNSCICINNQSNLDVLPLSECEESCEVFVERICGGEAKYSIYLTDNFIIHENKATLWRCIDNVLHCVPCNKGRNGYNCEILDCTINKGNCEKKVCDSGSDKFKYLGGSCQCPLGTYFVEDRSCMDIDECQYNNICQGECFNTFGSYVCGCIDGLHYINGTCTDIDECVENVSCDTLTTICHNRFGGFSCECMDGYVRKSRVECKDIDECIRRNLCDNTTTTCMNIVGSYLCNCLLNHVRVNADSCLKVDICPVDDKCDPLSTICVNYKGNISCHCKNGFHRSTYYSCLDINECRGKQVCDEVSTTCTNNPGSFLCDCLPGHLRVNRFICKDEDECETLQHKCSRSSKCRNTMGSYDCDCREGTKIIIYEHVIECEDIDECKDTYTCENDISYCLNIEGSYICVCMTGYVAVGQNLCERDSSKNITTIDDYLTSDADQDVGSKNIMFSSFITFLYIFSGTLAFGLILMAALLFIQLKRHRESSTESFE